MMKKIYKTPTIEILAEEEMLLQAISQGDSTGGGGHRFPSQGKSTFTFVGSLNDEDL